MIDTLKYNLKRGKSNPLPSDGGSPPAGRERIARLAAAAAPSNVRRERVRPRRRPRRGQSPAFPTAAIGLVVLPVSVHVFPPG